MSMKLIHRFTANTLRCYDAHLVQGQDVLGVLTRMQLADEGPELHRVNELALINLHKRRCEQVITYSCVGPGTDGLTEDALLRYDPVQSRWVIAQLQGGWYWYVGMRTLKVKEDGGLALSPLCLLEQGFDISSMNPLLDLEIRSDSYRFLYHRRFPDHLWVPRIKKLDVRVWEAWDLLEEQIATLRAGETSGPTNWQDWLHTSEQQASTRHTVDRVLLPEQATFDPRTTNASHTSDIEVTSQGEVMEAEMAWTMMGEATRLLALCSPEVSPGDLSEEELVALPPPPSWYVNLPVSRSARNAPPQWHVWLTGWDRDTLNYRWAYTPDIGLPFDDVLSQGDDPHWPAAYVAALAGPDTTNQQTTFVAVVALSQLEQDVYVSREREGDDRDDGAEDDANGKSLFDNDNDNDDEVEDTNEDDDEVVEIRWGKPYGPIQSCGVCLTHDGQVVQKAVGSFGLRPSLYRCGELIIGVDEPAEGWRLWNWAAAQENHLRTTLTLDPSCRHAFVCAEAESTTFWLIEETPEGVRISKRDAVTLLEVTEVELLSGARLLVESPDLLYPLRERPLNPQRNPGLIPYQETLLVLVMSERDEMELYQVQ